MHIKLNNCILPPIFILTLIVFKTNCHAQWKLELEKEDVKVYSKSSSNSLVYYKAEATIPCSIDKLYSFFLNFSAYPSWVNNCTQTNVIQEFTDSLYIIYYYFDFPWPASNRESVSRMTIKHLNANEIEVKAAPSAYELPKNNKAIRIVNFEESYTLKAISDNEVYLLMQGGYDVGGFIPDILMERMLKYGPFDVIAKIKKLTK